MPKCDLHQLNNCLICRVAAQTRELADGEIAGRHALPSDRKLLSMDRAGVDAQPRFALGDQVRLKAHPSRVGWVVGPPPRKHTSGWEYRITFSGAQPSWYGEAFLEGVTEQLRWTTTQGVLRDILLAKLRNPLTDSLYAYRASRTDFEPYQFRPALKFLRSAGRGLLIADEVGLGKTIEAAIIYLELKARMDISRVLVLCPSRLTAKWRDELRNRFEEQFDVLDSYRVRRLFADFERYGPSFPLRAIASFEMLRRAQFVERLVELNIPLDLLIVDEAHYMRNAEAATYQLGATLVNTADASIFLTATPLHLRNQDLFNLLNLLAPEEFDNLRLFEQQVRPNEYVNRASQYVADPRRPLSDAWTELRRVESTDMRDRFTGNPFYGDVLARLATPDELDFRERVAIQRALIDLNTLSSVLTRTRKREVAHAAVRAVFTVPVHLSPTERAFYDRILGVTREELRLAQDASSAVNSRVNIRHISPAEIGSVPQRVPGFAAVMRERQAASCLAAMREVYEESARRRRAASLEVERSPFDVHAETETDAKEAATDELLTLSRRIGNADSKFGRFEETLRLALAEDPTSKALVFSFFRRTLAYLHRELRDRGYDVEVIHGDVPIEHRNRIIDEFRNDANFRVLLSSEVGAEGLDFEFCDVLVNYDLPWNPMQVEQRIGRLDRFGQMHPRIRIYNFCIEDTIETRIFQRLYDRIKLFEQSIGDLEAILGDEITELSRRVLQGTLTAEEEAQLAEEAAARIVRRQREQEQLEREKDSLLGQGAILDQQVNETVSDGRVVSASEVHALVATFLAERFPRSMLAGDAGDGTWTLTLDVDLIDYLNRFVEQRRLHHRVSGRFREALGQRQRIALTFESDVARQRPLLDFVTVRHPLAEAARMYWADQAHGSVSATTITMEGPRDEAGDGYFFVHLQEVIGVVRHVSLEPVIFLDDGRFAVVSSHQLLRALQQVAASPAANLAGSSDGLAAAERLAADVMARRRDQVAEDTRVHNERLLAARSASISASFEAKIRRTGELLGQAREERIKRMRVAQIQNLRARRDNKLEELQRARDITVSSALIAAGRVRILPEDRKN